MLNEHKQRLAQAFEAAAVALAATSGDAAAIEAAGRARAVLDRPKQADHGDLACNLALQLAKALRRNPREVAQALVDAVRASPAGELLESAEIAGPGFVNLRLAPSAKRQVIGQVFAEGERYGRAVPATSPGRVLVEFVSANPTGPLHVGHGRQAALGDAIATLLEAVGWQVQRDYIADIARGYMAGVTVSAQRVEPVTGRADPADLDAVRAFAVASLRHEQDLDLQAFGVRFDMYYLESSLYSEGKVAATVEGLGRTGHTYEQDGALWLR
jgi:arginyl-tRNA synthetase